MSKFLHHKHSNIFSIKIINYNEEDNIYISNKKSDYERNASFKILNKKYNTTPNQYNLIIINALIQNKHFRYLINFREDLIYNNFECEYIPKLYKGKEKIRKNIKNYGAKFKIIIKYFINPFITNFKLNKSMAKYKRRLANTYCQKKEGKITSEQTIKNGFSALFTKEVLYKLSKEDILISKNIENIITPIHQSEEEIFKIDSKKLLERCKNNGRNNEENDISDSFNLIIKELFGKEIINDEKLKNINKSKTNFSGFPKISKSSSKNYSKKNPNISKNKDLKKRKLKEDNIPIYSKNNKNLNENIIYKNLKLRKSFLNISSGLIDPNEIYKPIKFMDGVSHKYVLNNKKTIKFVNNIYIMKITKYNNLFNSNRIIKDNINKKFFNSYFTEDKRINIVKKLKIINPKRYNNEMENNIILKLIIKNKHRSCSNHKNKNKFI